MMMRWRSLNGPRLMGLNKDMGMDCDRKENWLGVLVCG